MRDPVLGMLLALTLALAGCARSGGGESVDDPYVAPTSLPSASFQVAALTIRPAADPARETLYEDDGAATVRFVIAQPASAPPETAFVTYLLNGRIIETQQISLGPGEERAYERSVTDLRASPTLDIEVRAGASTKRASAAVNAWPRAGSETLVFGPFTIRADYGLLEQDDRVLVNLTLRNIGPAQTFDDLRVKMLCVVAQGEIAETRNVRIAPPGPGNATAVDISVEDCRSERYGLEFKANTDGGQEIFARLLLVPKGWTPPTDA